MIFIYSYSFCFIVLFFNFVFYNCLFIFFIMYFFKPRKFIAVDFRDCSALYHFAGIAFILILSQSRVLMCAYKQDKYAPARRMARLAFAMWTIARYAPTICLLSCLCHCNTHIEMALIVLLQIYKVSYTSSPYSLSVQNSILEKQSS